MQFVTPRLLDLSLFGNAGQFQQTDKLAMWLAGWITSRGFEKQTGSRRLQQNKQLKFHGAGLKVIVSGVWTDTARPFMV
jgi:hypothetical protein